MKSLLVNAIVLISIGFCIIACSSDENNISNDDSNISVILLLQDENGTEKYIFNEKENIIFRLDIANHGKEDAILPPLVDIIGNDIFHVYSSDEQDFGKPWDDLSIEEVGHILVKANGVRTFLCSWINNSDSDIPLGPFFLEYQIDKIRPLPKGDYHCQFDVNLGSDVRTCQQNFIVK